jgi:hypothetical protein
VLARIANILLGKAVTLVLAALAFLVGLATFVFLARGTPFGLQPGVSVGLLLGNLSAVLLLVAVLAGRLTRVWVERRRGSAGSRLHVRLVLLFGGVAVAPAILVACFAVAFFHFGIQAWFNDPVRQAVTESLQVSRGYLDEHRDNIRSVALEMANDLTRAGQFLSADPSVFVEVLGTQTTLRGLTEAVIYDPLTRQVLAAAGLFVGMGIELPSQSVTSQAQGGDVVVLLPRRDARSGRGAARFDATADADDRPAGGSVDPRSHDADRAGGGRIPAPRPGSFVVAARLRLDLCHRGAAGAARGGGDRSGAGQPDRSSDRAVDPRRGTRARRRSRGAGRGGADRRRARRPVARVQPDDRPARRPAR